MNYDEARKVHLLKLLQRFGLVDQFDPAIETLQHPSHDSVTSGMPLDSVADSLSKPGEIPAVQDRFHALLKRRLLIEAQQKPPLFPWEKEGVEYDPEPARSEELDGELAASVWIAQVRQLQLPVSMPESVLTELLARCQAVLFSPLREGAKLVRAVDALFEGQAQLLNDIARYVVVSPARSSLTLQDLVTAAGSEMPDSYDGAIKTQQMALSLLAAREILSTLSLTVSQTQSIQRDWITELGAVVIQLQFDGTRLKINAELPCGGSLQVQGNQVRSSVDRNDAGRLSLEIPEVTPNSVYPLEVRLGEQDLLTFAIYPQD